MKTTRFPILLLALATLFIKGSFAHTLHEHKGNAPVSVEAVMVSSIAALKGFKYISILDSFLFANSFHNDQKIFYLNLNTLALDSLHLSDSLIAQLYALCGITAQPSQIRSFMESHQVSLPIYKFFPELLTCDTVMRMQVVLYYFDPTLPIDPARPVWHAFEAAFSPAKGKLSFERIGSYSKLAVELPLIYEATDTMLWSDGEPILLSYKADRSKEAFRLSAFRDTFSRAGLQQFLGKSFNNLKIYLSHNYRQPYVL